MDQAENKEDVLMCSANILRREYETNKFFQDATVRSVEAAVRDGMKILGIENILEPSEYRTIARKVADRIYGSD